MATDVLSFMDPTLIWTVVTFGIGSVVLCAVLYIFSMFSMKDSSFEDALAEQKRAKEKEEKERQRLNKLKKENQKKKMDMKKKKVQESTPPAVVEVPKAPEPEPPKSAAPVVSKKKQEPAKTSEKGKKKEPVSILKAKEETKPQKVTEVPKQAPVKSSKQEKKNKKAEKEAEKSTGRKRSVSFSDDVEKKTEKKAEAGGDGDKADKLKKKKGKKTSQPQQEMNEHPIITSMKDVTFGEGDVQLLLTHLKAKYDVTLGNPRKEESMQQQIFKKEQALQQSMSRCMEAEKKIEKLNQDVAAEKNKFASLEKSLKEQQKKVEIQYQKEIEQLKGKLAQAGDVDILRKEIVALKTENSIFKSEVEKNARMTNDLQNANHSLQDSIRRNNELEKELHDYKMHSDQRNSQKVELDAQYQRQISDLTMNIQQQESNYTIVSAELNKVKSELQSSQGDSAKLVEQIALLNEANSNLRVWEEKYNAEEQKAAQIQREKENLESANQGFSGEIVSLQQEITNLQEQCKKLSEESSGQIQSNETLVQEKVDALKASEEKLEESKDEVKKYLEECEKLKKKNNDLREKNWKAMDVVSNLEKTVNDKVKEEEGNSRRKIKEVKEEVKSALKKSFPDVSCNVQDFSEYLNTVLNEINSLQTTEIVSVEGPELKSANAKIEELQSSLSVKSSENDNLQSRIQALQQSLNGALDRARQNEQSSDNSDSLAQLQKDSQEANAEVEKYKNILHSTEDILSKLQASVETEETVWRKKVEEAHDVAQTAKKGTEELRVAIEKLSAENASLQDSAAQNEKLQNEITQLKKEMESSKKPQENGNCDSEAFVNISPIHLTHTEQQCETTPSKSVSCQSESPVKVECADACTDTRPVVQDQDGFLVIENIEEVVDRTHCMPHYFTSSVNHLHFPLNFFEVYFGFKGTNFQNGYLVEENEKLKERLDQEKQMTKNLGQAATKLQSVLKQTQDQLNKEREKTKSLSDKLDGSFEQNKSVGSIPGVEEGTSV